MDKFIKRIFILHVRVCIRKKKHFNIVIIIIYLETDFWCSVYRSMFKAMTTYHREEINLFCTNLFSGKNKHLYDVINSYTYMVTKIDIQQLNLSRDTFNESF